MNEWVKFYEDVMGFGLYQHFDDNDISTEYSALMSKVMANGNGYVKFPINEPAEGKRKSQIEEYLDFYGGPACSILRWRPTTFSTRSRRMKQQGVEFLTVPHTYYTELQGASARSMSRSMNWSGWASWSTATTRATCCRSSRGPVEDRPTLFYEIIQRKGSRSFGKGNFKALFEAIEREQAFLRCSQPRASRQRHGCGLATRSNTLLSRISFTMFLAMCRCTPIQFLRLFSHTMGNSVRA
jgi:4-hydroxyphenylpyruvate dioxygenase